MNTMHVRFGRGFTLLELLVAMTILAIIGVALFTVFNQSTETWQRADTRTRQFVAGREALDLMASELRQAILAPNAVAGYGAQFYAFAAETIEPSSDPGWRADVSTRCGQVYFVAPTEMRPAAAKQDICVIGYWVNDERELMRYCLSDDQAEWQTFDPSTERDELSQRLGLHVVELRFEFWARTDSEWDPDDKNRHAWNSETSEALPQAVRITLTAWDPTLPDDADLDDPDPDERAKVRKRLKTFMTVVRLNTATR